MFRRIVAGALALLMVAAFAPIARADPITSDFTLAAYQDERTEHSPDGGTTYSSLYAVATSGKAVGSGHSVSTFGSALTRYTLAADGTTVAYEYWSISQAPGLTLQTDSKVLETTVSGPATYVHAVFDFEHQTWDETTGSTTVSMTWTGSDPLTSVHDTTVYDPGNVNQITMGRVRMREHANVTGSILDLDLPLAENNYAIVYQARYVNVIPMQ